MKHPDRTTIIVEGMDHTGKTTLCEALINAYQDAYILHSSKPTQNNPWWEMQRFLQSYHGFAIMDRNHIFGEYIYGKYLRNENLMDEVSLEKWFSIMAETNTIIIYCRPDHDTLFATLGKKDEMEGVVENGPALLTAYDDLIFQLMRYNQEAGTGIPIPLIIHDYLSDPECEEVINQIDKLINEEVTANERK